MDKRWVYDGSQEAYPVEVGQVWSAGDSTLAVWDYEDGPPPFRVMADLCLVDPPWNRGLARGYRTKAASTNEGIASFPVDFAALLHTILSTIRTAAPACLLEMGYGEKDLCIALGTEVGMKARAVYPATYYKTKPCVVIAYDTMLPEIAGMDDGEWPAVAVAKLTKPDATIFDPCFGRGLMAVAAVAQGRTFVGTELNPTRVAVTLSKLAALGQPIARVA